MKADRVAERDPVRVTLPGYPTPVDALVYGRRRHRGVDQLLLRVKDLRGALTFTWTNSSRCEQQREAGA